ncbi:MAG TPA: NUDIX domain-containing protein [Candidatus Thermoplasmatota archaeon]|nr:NUDIX domain-containing protein [Candidatus Thermoplasmatota archaeon]
MTLPVAPPTRPTGPRGHVDEHHFYNSEGAVLRLQCFVIVRNKDRRLACLRLEGYDGWMLPGETVRKNESPAECAKRIVDTWFATPVTPRVVGFQNYPDDGDKRWYVIIVFEADEPAGGLKGTPDTLEIAWVPAGKPPGAFAMSHADVFSRLPP